MELYVFDNDLNALDIVDSDSTLSCMWTMCYNEAGSFELYLPAIPRYVNLFKPLRYVYRADVDEAMYIDTIIERYDGDNSAKTITVSGVSLDGLLAKRVIRNAPEGQGITIGNAINSVISVNPIPHLTVGSVNSGIPDAMQYVSATGTNLDEYIRNMLAAFEKMRDYGPNVDTYEDMCRVRLLPVDKKLVFETFASRYIVDRVIFSEYYDNFKNGQFEYSEKGCCTSVFVSTKMPNIDGVLDANGDMGSQVDRYDAQIESWTLAYDQILNGYTDSDGTFHPGYGGDTQKAYEESAEYREIVATIQRLNAERAEYIKIQNAQFSGVPSYFFGEQGSLYGFEEYVEIPTVVKYSYTDANGNKHFYIDYQETWNNAQAKSNELMNKIPENYNGEVASGDYRTVFKVGDIVSIRDDHRKMTYHKRIMKVEENWDSSSGYTVKPVFGDSLKTIYDLIK